MFLFNINESCNYNLGHIDHVGKTLVSEYIDGRFCFVALLHDLGSVYQKNAVIY